jgi:hemerythrin-like metal-binding protein
MAPVEWTSADLVFSRQLDADHRKLFEELEKVRQAADANPGMRELSFRVWRLSKDLSIHFKSEERLMNQCRYPARLWHRRQHQAGRNKMGRLLEAARSGRGDTRTELEDFAKWLRDHVHLADRMFAAHLRNDQRVKLAS